MDLCKNDIIEVTVESLGYRGEGVARLDRVPVFVNGSLPGEKVRAVVILVKKDYVVAKLLEVLIPSIERTEPKCPYFGKCGGCNLQHLDYECQLEYKKNLIRDSFRKIARIELPDFDVIRSELSYGYRNKISLPVRKVNGETKIGLYAYNSHRIIEIDSCPLQTEKTNMLIPRLRELMRDFEAFDEEKNTGEIKHFVARELGGKVSLTVIAKTDILDKLKTSIEKIPGLADEIWLNINEKNSNVIFGEKTVFVAGERIETEVMGYNIAVHPNAFLQVNELIARKLYDYALSLIRNINSETIIDAYCGCGILTAMISGAARNVIGIEIVREAVESAIALHKSLGIDNTSFICGDCHEELSRVVSEKQGNSLVVLDPPRAGCDDKSVSAINESGSRAILYISCDPATLARDISKLSNYTVESIKAFDMFPQTRHVETVILLCRANC